MSAGIQFNNASLARIIDGERIVPQMIARYDLSNYPHFDLTEADGVHPGWNLRVYQFDFPSSVFSRPIIIFQTLPNQGYEVYSSGYSVAYKTGQPFVDPIWYVFALDYVSYSAATHGLRLWRAGGGPLVYDSGNLHLNVQSITGLTVDTATGAKSADYPTGAVRSFNGPFPASGAYVLPRVEVFREYGTRFDGFGTWRAYPYYRIRGGTIDSLMLASDREYTFDETYSSPNYDHIYKGSADNLVLMAVNASMYD